MSFGHNFLFKRLYFGEFVDIIFCSHVFSSYFMNFRKYLFYMCHLKINLEEKQEY